MPVIMHRIKLSSKVRHHKSILTVVKLVTVMLVLTLAAVRTSDLYVSTSTSFQNNARHLPSRTIRQYDHTQPQHPQQQQQQQDDNNQHQYQQQQQLRSNSAHELKFDSIPITASNVTSFKTTTFDALSDTLSNTVVNTNDDDDDVDNDNDNGDGGGDGVTNVNHTDDTDRRGHTSATSNTTATKSALDAGRTPPLTNSTQTAAAPGCGHVLVFTGPRHGSTWFLNNVENCSYSHSDGTFGRLHDNSELWVPRPYSNVMNISVADAQHWIVHNVSMKIFPWPWRNRPDDAKKILFHAIRHGVPVVLLERDVYQAFRSIMLAMRTKRWDDNARRTGTDAHASIQASEDLDHVDELVSRMVKTNDKHWVQFKKDMNSHLEQVSTFLDHSRLSYDRVKYDDIVNVPSITLTNARCIIRNCNFVNK